jgi:hypothetical protein
MNLELRSRPRVPQSSGHNVIKTAVTVQMKIITAMIQVHAE